MKRIPDFAPVKSEMGVASLPVGAHGVVCRAAYVRPLNGTSPKEKLVLEFDVAQGPYAGHFARQYERDAKFLNRRWRGIYEIVLPLEGEGQPGEWSRQRLGHFLACVAESNPGWAWDWDEKALVGVRFAALYRECEWRDREGELRISTECGGVVSIQDMETGYVPALKRRTLKKAAAGRGGPQNLGDDED